MDDSLRQMVWLVVAVLMLGVASSGQTTAPATAPTAPPSVGESAPDFTLPSLDGSNVRLHQLTENGPVVLIVLRGWPGYQCPICNQQMGAFLAAAERFKASGARIVMIYPGPAKNLDERAKEFTQGQVLPDGFHFVTDPGYLFTNAYHLRWQTPGETAYPSTFVVDAGNVIRFVRVSRTHGGRATVDQVLTALDELNPKK